VSFSNYLTLGLCFNSKHRSFYRLDVPLSPNKRRNTKGIQSNDTNPTNLFWISNKLKRHQLLTIPKHSEISAVTALCKLIVNWDDSQCTDAEAGSELQTAAAAARLAGMTGTAAYWAEPYWAGLAAK